MSELGPVYAEIDRREPHPHAIGDTGAYEVPPPMQCQHVPRSADSVGGAKDKDGVDLTRNELIQNVICQGDTAAYEVIDPSLHAMRSADAVGGANDKDGVDLTRSEAYDLIQ